MKKPGKFLIGFISLILFFLLIALPFYVSTYLLHILILLFVWSAITVAWSYMGRFGLLSLGHGAVLGIGVYTTTLLFNFYRLSPWIGMFIAALLAVIFFAGIGYFCFRFGVIGHYFAITTLVETMVIYLLIINFRDYTGGSLGLTVHPLGTAPLYFQFDHKMYFYFFALAFFLLTLYIWKKIDHSSVKKAMTAIENDEVAASSVGITIWKYKTIVTAISAFMTVIGGVIYTQYMMSLQPDTTASVDVSLTLSFKAILGGMYSLWGPLIGNILIIGLEEYFRVAYGAKFISWAMAAYGVIIVVLIIFFPKGLHGTLSEWLTKKRLSQHRTAPVIK